MLGLCICEIAEKKEEVSNWVVLGKLFLAIIVIPAIIVFSIKGCWRYIDSKFDVNEDSKIYKFFTAISIILLFVPVIIFAQLPLIGFSNSLFDSSDILGYYGAIIGGGVTVLGVYWTLNYENKKSKEERKQERENLKEERRKDSLPILRFNFTPEQISYNKNTIRELETDKDGNLFSDYDIAIDTTVGKNGFKKYSYHSFIEYGKLNIENVGLGVAVFSKILLKRNKKRKVCKNLNSRGLERFLVVPGKEISLNMFIRSDDFNEEDELLFYFTDLYSNEYYYIIPYENMRQKYPIYKTTIVPNAVEPIPILRQRNK